MQETQEKQVWSLGQEDLLEEGMAMGSSILAWKIPQTEESGRLQSIESQRVGCDWSMHAHVDGLDLENKIKRRIQHKFWVFVVIFFLSFFFFHLAVPLGMWDLISPIRNWTQVPCIERWRLNHWTTREVPVVIFWWRKLGEGQRCRATGIRSWV